MSITTNNLRYLYAGILLGVWALWMYCTQAHEPQPRRVRRMPVRNISNLLDTDEYEAVG